jgi:hypothetical protein
VVEDEPAADVSHDRAVALRELPIQEPTMGWQIATLEKGTSSLFSHSDPAMVKSMSERHLDI